MIINSKLYFGVILLCKNNKITDNLLENILNSRSLSLFYQEPNTISPCFCKKEEQLILLQKPTRRLRLSDVSNSKTKYCTEVSS